MGKYIVFKANFYFYIHMNVCLKKVKMNVGRLLKIVLRGFIAMLQVLSFCIYFYNFFLIALCLLLGRYMHELHVPEKIF